MERTDGGGGTGKNEVTKCETNHCFLAFSEYIAMQRARCARPFMAGLPF
jgi:hypothetical protein